MRSELGADAPSDAVRVSARFVLQMQALVSAADDPLAVLAAGFDLLAPGWAAVEG